MIEMLIAINRIYCYKEGFLQALYIKAVSYEKIEFLKNIDTHGEFQVRNRRNPEILDFQA